MFDLRVEQPINPPELSPAEQSAMDDFLRFRERQIEAVVCVRMLDPEYVLDAIQVCLTDNITTQARMAELIIGRGDKSIHIANLKLDCMDWIRSQAKKEAERGML